MHPAAIRKASWICIANITLPMKKWPLLCSIIAFCGPCGLPAQGLTTIDYRKNRVQEASVFPHATRPAAGLITYRKPGELFAGTHFLTKNLALVFPFFSSTATESLLPKWTPESLPFFCRIEHDCGKRLPFAFKFRLGSVEYVDWLEGKTLWSAQ